jgi:progressive ankylosis protein
MYLYFALDATMFTDDIDCMEYTSGDSIPHKSSSVLIHCTSPRRALILFTVPLAAVNILQVLSQHVILGGISRHPQPVMTVVEDLAAFVVALGLMWVFTSPIQGLGKLFLAFGDGPDVRLRLQRFAWVLAITCTAVLALLAFTPIGFWVVTRIQGLSPTIALRVQCALMPFVLWPAIDVLLHMDNAILKRNGRSGTLALANVLGLLFTIVTVCGGHYFRIDPLLMAPLAYLIGQGMRVAFLFGSVLAVRRENLLDEAADFTRESRRCTAAPPSWSVLTMFFLPVTFNILLMVLSRPLIQWFLSMEQSPANAIAAFGVALSLSQMFYNWLNELSTHSIAFRHQPEILRALPQFGTQLAVATTFIMGALFWTPLGGTLLSSLIGLRGDVLAQTCDALAVMVLSPAVVAARAHHHGLATLHKESNAWMSSAVARVGANAIAMVLLRFFGFGGAMLGAMALINGFLFEALVMAWGLSGRIHTLQVQRT